MTCVESLQAATDNQGKVGARPIGQKFWYIYATIPDYQDNPWGRWEKWNARGLINRCPVFGPKVALAEWETVEIKP